MKEKYILALDLGTTGNRAILFDKKQNIISQVYEEFPQIYPQAGWVEHDATAIWRSTLKILRKTLAKYPADTIAALGVTNQRETVLLWDRVTGKPIHNAIVWQCRRTAKFCDTLKKNNYAGVIRRKTGLTIDPYFSASKIRWLLKNVPAVKRLKKNGRLLAGTIDSWIVWKLSGGKAHVTDSSNASRTMLFNIHKLSWDKELCALFKVPMGILPRVVPSSAVIAHTNKKITGANIVISGIVGDQQGAAFAQGVFSPGVVKNTYGTGLFALENTGKKPIFSKNLLTTVAWSIGDIQKTEYAVEGSVFIAGAAIQWLRDGLKVIKKANESEAMAKSLATNENIYFVPAFVGLGAPYWDSSARGMIIGITRGTQREHLVRAALEASAYQTRDILEVMQKDTGNKLKKLQVDGGASANNFLMQFQADILGIAVERPKILETTALGAAGLAGIAIGFWKNKEEFRRLRRIDKIFYPKLSHKLQESLYARWQKAVERSRSWAW